MSTCLIRGIRRICWPLLDRKQQYSTLGWLQGMRFCHNCRTGTYNWLNSRGAFRKRACKEAGKAYNGARGLQRPIGVFWGCVTKAGIGPSLLCHHFSARSLTSSTTAILLVQKDMPSLTEFCISNFAGISHFFPPGFTSSCVYHKPILITVSKFMTTNHTNVIICCLEAISQVTNFYNYIWMWYRMAPAARGEWTVIIGLWPRPQLMPNEALSWWTWHCNKICLVSLEAPWGWCWLL